MSDRKIQTKLAVQRWRYKLKQKAVEYKGGKCEICGYNKCLDALEFHHTSPNEKEFGISSSGYTRKWEKVKEELDKCILVCSNCHREIHHKLNQKNKQPYDVKDYKIIDKINIDKVKEYITLKYPKTKICNLLQVSKNTLNRFLKQNDIVYSQEKREIPSKDVLEQLISEKSFIGIGKMYDVTDNAVRKWCKKYNLPYRKKDIIK